MAKCNSFSCDAELDLVDNFCYKCGEDQGHMVCMTDPTHSVRTNARFCSQCGSGTRKREKAPKPNTFYR